VERAGRFVGVYRNSSSPHTTFIKIIELFGAYRVEISDPGDGTLLLLVEGLELRFVEAEPLYFRQVDGPFAMVFREDKQGRITHMYTDFMPQYTTIKLKWYETSGFNMTLLLGCILLFLSMIPVAAIRAIQSRRSSSDGRTATRGARIANWIIVGISLLNVLIVVGSVWGKEVGLQSELLDPPLILIIVLGLGALSALLTVGAVFCAALAWKDGFWSVFFRAYYTLMTIAALAFVWFMNYWNLMGQRY